MIQTRRLLRMQKEIVVLGRLPCRELQTKDQGTLQGEVLHGISIQKQTDDKNFYYAARLCSDYNI